MNHYRVLIVEDDKKMNKGLYHVMNKVDSGEKALKEIKRIEFDLIISDMRLPGINGGEVLMAAKQYDPHIMFIMITAYGQVDTAVSAMKKGAEDYILKPFDMEELRVVVKKALEKRELYIQSARLQHQLQQKYTFKNIIGNSEAMMTVVFIFKSWSSSLAIWV